MNFLRFDHLRFAFGFRISDFEFSLTHIRREPRCADLADGADDVADPEIQFLSAPAVSVYAGIGVVRIGIIQRNGFAADDALDSRQRDRDRGSGRA